MGVEKRDRLPNSDADALKLRDGVAEMLRVWLPVGLPLEVEVPVLKDDGVGVGVVLSEVVARGVPVGVKEMLRVPDVLPPNDMKWVGEGDTVVLLLRVLLPVPLGVRVGLPVGKSVKEGVREAVGVSGPDGVALGVKDDV